MIDQYYIDKGTLAGLIRRLPEYVSDPDDYNDYLMALLELQERMTLPQPAFIVSSGHYDAYTVAVVSTKERADEIAEIMPEAQVHPWTLDRFEKPTRWRVTISFRWEGDPIPYPLESFMDWYESGVEIDNYHFTWIGEARTWKEAVDKAREAKDTLYLR